MKKFKILFKIILLLLGITPTHALNLSKTKILNLALGSSTSWSLYTFDSLSKTLNFDLDTAINNEAITYSNLQQYDVLVINSNQVLRQLTTDNKNALKSYIINGGGIIHLGENLTDTGWSWFSDTLIGMKQITENVTKDSIVLHRHNSLKSIDSLYPTYFSYFPDSVKINRGRAISFIETKPNNLNILVKARFTFFNQSTITDQPLVWSNRVGNGRIMTISNTIFASNSNKLVYLYNFIQGAILFTSGAVGCRDSSSDLYIGTLIRQEPKTTYPLINLCNRFNGNHLSIQTGNQWVFNHTINCTSCPDGYLGPKIWNGKLTREITSFYLIGIDSVFNFIDTYVDYLGKKSNKNGAITKSNGVYHITSTTQWDCFSKFLLPQSLNGLLNIDKQQSKDSGWFFNYRENICSNSEFEGLCLTADSSIYSVAILKDFGFFSCSDGTNFLNFDQFYKNPTNINNININEKSFNNTINRTVKVNKANSILFIINKNEFFIDGKSK